MTNTAQIKEHMKVVGSDGQPVGTVDKIQGNTIILTKSDPLSGGQHHSIPTSMVGSVEKDSVKLNVSAQQAQKQWQVVGGSSQQNQADGTATGRGASR